MIWLCTKFPLFASAITGRDYFVVMENVNKPRTAEEKQMMSDGMSLPLSWKMYWFANLVLFSTIGGSASTIDTDAVTSSTNYIVNP